MDKARLVKRGQSSPVETRQPVKRERTAEEIRRQWLAERKQTQTDTAALRRKLFGR